MESAIETASKEVQLLNAGWVEKYGFWKHPKKAYQGLPYLFKFEDACVAEGILPRKEYRGTSINV